MKTRHIVEFEAIDGKRFINEDECKKYEDSLLKKNESITVNVDGKPISKKEVNTFFTVIKCNFCPFAIECNKLHDFMREYTTDTLNICEVIHGHY